MWIKLVCLLSNCNEIIIIWLILSFTAKGGVISQACLSHVIVLNALVLNIHKHIIQGQWPSQYIQLSYSMQKSTKAILYASYRTQFDRPGAHQGVKQIAISNSNLEGTKNKAKTLYSTIKWWYRLTTQKTDHTVPIMQLTYITLIFMYVTGSILPIDKYACCCL